MTKIKNFRVALRAREIARWLKKERAVESTPDLEVAIEHLIQESKAWIKPAAVYTTLTHQTAEKTTSITLPKNAVALSVAIVSVGADLEAERAKPNADPLREVLLAALVPESLSQSLQFTMRLLSEQAKEEDCEMSAAALVEDPALALSLASLVGVARIGIELESASSTLPAYVRVAYTFWTPVGKGSSRRAEPAARGEKVAA